MSAPDPSPERPRPMLLSNEIGPERDCVRIRPAGELDVSTVPDLRDELAELRRAGFKRLILDLSKLEYIDSTGLRLVFHLDAEARRDSFELRLVPGDAAIQRVFDSPTPPAGCRSPTHDADGAHRFHRSARHARPAPRARQRAVP